MPVVERCVQCATALALFTSDVVDTEQPQPDPVGRSIVDDLEVRGRGHQEIDAARTDGVTPEQGCRILGMRHADRSVDGIQVQARQLVTDALEDVLLGSAA